MEAEKTQNETTLELFQSLTPEERGKRVAISFYDDDVFMLFGSLLEPSMILTEEQIAQLPEVWRTKWEKAKAKVAIKGCSLLAGEETEIVAQGSLHYCRQQVGLLPYKDLPRDSYSGKGCWVIVRNGETLEEGCFDKYTAW